MRSFDELQANASASADWFDAYHTYDENYNWWKSEQALYPTITTVGDLAQKSFQGRAIQYFKINTATTKKPIIYVQCQIHAREWISTPVCQWLADTLLAGYTAKKANETTILGYFDFAFITNINPDGFVYTQTDRQWRKNRRTTSNPSCPGVDLNRNYNTNWGKGGSSTNPCSDTYMGTAAGSEIEVQASVGFIQQLQKDNSLYAGIDVHSYSQLVLRPWGYTTTNSPNEAQMKQLGDLWAKGIRDTTGKVYTSQKSIDLYVTTGTASDWFYDDQTGAAKTNGVVGKQVIRPAGFTVELRPTDQVPGFQLPPREIIPTAQENYAGMTNFFMWFINTNKGPLLSNP